MPVEFSVRADLYRVAHSFTNPHLAALNGVRIEALPEGGVVLVGWNGAELIVIEDETGQISAPATIQVGRSMVNLAVDLFRRGKATRLSGDGACAFIEPRITGGAAAQNYVRGEPYPDWRAELAGHGSGRLETPLIYDARMVRRISDAAIGLSGDDEPELFELCGGNGGVVVTFPAFPKARALFRHSIAVSQARAAR